MKKISLFFYSLLQSQNDHKNHNHYLKTLIIFDWEKNGGHA